MATYKELFGAKNNSDLQDKIAMAVVIAADSIRNDSSSPTNQAQRLAWAKEVMRDPIAQAKYMLWAVLAANKDAALSQIFSASDATIQTQVDSAVDLFVDN